MKASTKSKFTFFSVYLTFFVDSLCWAVVYPIFAPYFLATQDGLFSPDTSFGTRSIVLGFFLMAFSLGQFIGCPLIGEYADKHGRKKALALSVFATFGGMVLSAYSMQINSLFFLFLGRLATGFFASSATVCLSCISDLSESDRDRVKNFGALSVVIGLAFVAGAFLGGKLSDPTLSPLFSLHFPLWVASFLALVNFIFILFGFRETFQTHPKMKFHILEAFTHVKVALKTEKIKRIYLVYFLFLFSWAVLFQCVPILSVAKLSYNSSDLADLAFFVGVCWAFGSGYLSRLLSKKISSTLLLELALIGFTLFCAAVVYPKTSYGFFLVLGFCVVFAGMAWPICAGLISSKAPAEMRGKIMGLSQSVQSLAMTLGPVIGGLAFHVSFSFPFYIASSVSFAAVLVYYFILKNR